MLGRGLYYDKVCNIYTSSYSTINGSRTLSKTILKNLIPCSFWKSSNIENFTKTGIASQTDIERYFANLEPEHIEVRKGMQIEIFQPINGVNVSLGEFVVETTNFYEDHRGSLDNIELILYSRP